MKISNIHEATLKFRAEILRGDQAAQERLIKTYASVWKSSKDDLQRIVAENTGTFLEAAQKKRLESILKQTEQELFKFTSYAEKSIGQRQQALTAMAQAHTASLAKAGPTNALKAATWRTLPARQIEDLVGATSSGSPLHKVLDRLVPDGVEKVRSTLTSGIAMGKTPDMVAREIRDNLGGNLGKALTICRTEEQRAYNSSSLRAMRENDNIIQKWQWSASLSFSSCACCLAMHGTLCDLGDELDSHPNCRCIPTPWTGPAMTMESGSDWFRKQDEETQRRTLSHAKYELYKDNKIDLSDLIATSHSKEYGDSRFEKSLKDL